MRRIGVITLIFLSLSVFLACGTQSGEEGKKPETKQPEKKEGNPLVGTWKLQDDEFNVTIYFNSKGRVKTDTDGQICLGIYTTEDGRLSTIFDEGQTGCSSAKDVPYALVDSETMSVAGMATYKKIDDKDDTSF